MYVRPCRGVFMLEESSKIEAPQRTAPSALYVLVLEFASALDVSGHSVS